MSMLHHQFSHEQWGGGEGEGCHEPLSLIVYDCVYDLNSD